MWFWKKETEMGIDLGTATIQVATKDKGVVLQEPSVVAIDKNTNKILAVGESARQMIGRTPGNIIAVRPLREGVISDYEVTEQMLKYFIKKGSGKKIVSVHRIIICIPSEATEVQRRAVIDAAKSSGAKSVYLIEEPLAAAIGAGLNIYKPGGHMVVDMGGGTTDIAVISLGGTVVRASINVAGDKFDESITKYIKNKYKLLIGERTAENLKIKVASVIEGLRNESIEVKGRNLITGLPDTINIISSEVRVALEDQIKLIAEAVKSVLGKTPPELAADIIDEGILMTGGGALLYGLDKYLQQITGIKVRVAENAVCCVAEGTREVLKIFNKVNLKMNEEEVMLIEE